MTKRNAARSDIWTPNLNSIAVSVLFSLSAFQDYHFTASHLSYLLTYSPATMLLFLSDVVDKSIKQYLSDKAAGLCQIANEKNIPTLPGFLVTADSLDDLSNQKESVWCSIIDAVRELEEITGRQFGGSLDPLGLAVRASTQKPTAGTYCSILRVGLTKSVLLDLLQQNKCKPHIAIKSFIELLCRLSLQFSSDLGAQLNSLKSKTLMAHGVANLLDLSEIELYLLFERLLHCTHEEGGSQLISDPFLQLQMAVKDILQQFANTSNHVRSSSNDPGKYSIIIQSMASFYLEEGVGGGVVYTRHPVSGEKVLCGEQSIRVGEDTKLGVKSIKVNIDSSESKLASAHPDLQSVATDIEKLFKEPQDIEYVVQGEKLYVVQVRKARLSPQAIMKATLDMIDEGVITNHEGYKRIVELLKKHRQLWMVDHEKNLALAKGNPISSGVAIGYAVTNLQDFTNEKFPAILVKPCLDDSDILQINCYCAIVTGTCGLFGHVAAYAREANIAVVSDVDCEHLNRYMELTGKSSQSQANIITVDGYSGYIYDGTLPLVARTYEPQDRLHKLMQQSHM